MNLFLRTIILSAFLTSISCLRPAVKDKIEIPKGFTKYSKIIAPNKKKNLFFFHLHHCPNCTLVQNHLIRTDAFQEATKSYNRYFLELGSALGREILKKYSLRAAPVFVLADENFNHLSTSRTGLFSFSEFQNWLLTGKIHFGGEELKIITYLSKKYSLEDPKSYKGLFDLFKSLASDLPKNVNLKEFIKASNSQLTRWSNKNFTPLNSSANRYRIGLSYLSLSKLAKLDSDENFRNSLLKGIKEFSLMQKGSVKEDYGSYIFQLTAYIQLKDDESISKIIRKIEDAKTNNLTLLYLALSNSYWHYGKNCKKVFFYTSKLKLEEIPTGADKIYHVLDKARCYKKESNLEALQRDYKKLNEILSTEMKKAFPDRLGKIEKMIEDLKDKKSSGL